MPRYVLIFIKLVIGFKIVDYSMGELANQMNENSYMQKIESNIENFKSEIMIKNDH